MEPSSAAVEIGGGAAHQLLRSRLGHNDRSCRAALLLDADQSGFVGRPVGRRWSLLGQPCSEMRVVPVEEPQKYGVVVGVTEQPAPASGVVVGVLTEQPGASSGGAARGVVDQTLAMLDGLADEGGRGSLESLGRWNEKRSIFGASILGMCSDRAMPIKLEAKGDAETMVRVAFGKLVDELVQTNASSGILAISNWKEMRGPHKVTVSEVSWSASPDDTSYQRHGSVGMVSRIPENIVHFADFEPVIEALGEKNQIAVYRVTLPREGLDPDKWAGRPPPPAPADLYTGPRSDDLLSTEEISGEYFSSCFPFFCSFVTVTPIGADVIEVKKRGWSMFLCAYPCMPICANDILTREPRTNAFDTRQKDMILTQTESGLKWVQGEKEGSRTEFKDDGSMENDDGICCFDFCYRRRSKGRPFRKVETKDIAGTWCHYRTCLMPVPVWLCVAYTGALSTISCSTKTRLNEDQYKEGGCLCCSLLPLPLYPFSETRTRHYEKGHPTNWFDHHMGEGTDVLGHIYRDSGCVHGAIMASEAFPTMCLDCGWKCC